MSIDYQLLCGRYRRRFGLELLVTDADGKIVFGAPTETDCDCRNRSRSRRIDAAKHSLYWGEPVINLCCDFGYAMWGVPIMNNNEMVGALVVQGVDLEGKDKSFYRSVQEAANGLLEIAMEQNLVSRAAIEFARLRAQKEGDLVLTIEASKRNWISDDIRSIYLTEEPELLGAIKQGEIREARSILNRILTVIYGMAGERMDLLKSSVLELVVMMNRAAVEAGAEPVSVLGGNYRILTELSGIQDEEELAEWVRRMLESLIECIRINDRYPHSLLILKAVRFMENNLHQHLRRDEVARVAGLSPSHFSRLITERMGRNFSSLLTQMRVNRAKELLNQSEQSLGEIAIECGFFDQSHFNRCFRSETSISPGEFRKKAKSQ